MKTKQYNVIIVSEVSQLLGDIDFWNKIPKLSIDNYLWMNNSYKPIVESKLCYSDSHFYVNFKAYESEISTKFSKINDPVHKDSCVEFFVNLFPQITDEYFNFEINAIGTIYVGFGALGNRIKLSIEEIKKIEIVSKLKIPQKGSHGDDYWEVFYKIPVSIFEHHYGMRFNAEDAKGNFYKCGDEAQYEHYGTWNKINSENPNFHLPKYFGDLVFEK